ncbi:MAG TPA: phosphoribosylformylglycinamidine synthase subunit PurL [Candidatus Eremiobacteraceae bacterium]|nr:phosphoribosylformylglycinamidine synthase subunit PurL [Candidatus Eremiobacteraceae bacterium]
MGERAVTFASEALSCEGTDADLKALARRESLALTPAELRQIRDRIGRDPTRAEAHAFAIQWSEHCSYKSSRALLKKLPTQSRDVIVPVGEDAGILRAGSVDGVEYGVVVAHESHNHPSQVVPFEGAATGVGGILRDVLCMGAEVVASADPLRFGTAKPGSHAAYVAASVVEGIAAYGNAVGVPNIAGDVYFHDAFTDNCLVNVVALGLVRADRILHSRVPAGGAGYDLVLVGKATDGSGFGGAAFASLVLDAGEAQANKSAVQVPDPFLKNVIMRATSAVIEAVFEADVDAGFKDLGAGGIMGSSSELCSAGGFGARIDVEAIPQAVTGLPAFVVACAETQERMLWAVPPEFTPTVLEIYNERFTLPEVASGARAAVIGRVTEEKRYVVSAMGEAVIDLPIDVLTGSIVGGQATLAPASDSSPLQPTLVGGRAALAPASDSSLLHTEETLLRILAHPDVCSRRPIIENYDTVVRGATVIPSGYADAGVIVIRRGSRAGLALSVDGNPRFGSIDARLAAAHAVVESARNVAAVGALPIGLTDCLNYGNPEDPAAFRQLADGVDGLADAANSLHLGAPGEPLPFVSGNVSLYNESSTGRAIPPSAIVACIGRVEDVGRVVTMQITAAGNRLFLLGSRRPQLGGSVFAAIAALGPSPLPPIDYAEANASILAVIEGIRQSAVTAAHDISDGGLLACVAEMCLGGDAAGLIGANLNAPSDWAPQTDATSALFGEAGGFVVEVPSERIGAFEAACTASGAKPTAIGMTGGETRAVSDHCDVPLPLLAQAWSAPLQELFA